jgi:drug/metabolite transporter (DMT)-like permease
LLALAAAALFGLSTPLAKQLLAGAGPFTLAALLYLGAGLGLVGMRAVQRALERALRPTMQPAAPAREARLERRDWPWLAAAIVTGGVLAPVLLLAGLRDTPATTVSLLLAFEGILTALIAAVAFREAVSSRIWIALGLMLGGAALLVYQPGFRFSLPVAATAIVAACALWGMDNNLTRRISAADPVMITLVKGLVAGTVNAGLAFMLDESLPAPGDIVAALALGVASYGISLVLYIRALRHLGAARAASHFGTAPFFGALLSVVLLSEPVTATFVGAALLVAIASALMLSERHEHIHMHEALVHSHRHSHDEHHTHGHAAGEGAEPHTHEHRHEPTTHSHAHLPDIHHRHGH